jgi:serine/threonine protein kinase
LADFGFSKLKESFESMHPTTVGTLCYAAPEIVDAQPHSFPADVYSIGMVIFELLTLQPPFDTKRGVRAINNAVVAADRPPWPAAVANDPALRCSARVVDVER